MKLAVAFLAGCLVTGTILVQVMIDQRYKNDLKRSYFRAAIKELLKKHETCQAKFDKVTILYEQPKSTRNELAKMWAIPADVQPTYLGTDNAGSFTHLDPKTMAETGKVPAGKTLPAQVSALR